MIDEANASLMAGDIARTRHLLVERVKAAPTDRDARAFLFQLFSVMGLWDKAASALATFVAVAPDAAEFGAVYGGLIAAERAREQAFAHPAPSQAAFQALTASPPWFEGVLEALVQEAAGEGARAADLRAEAFDQAADTPGRLNDTPFATLADGDERFGPCLELILDGRYGLAPFEAIRSLVFQGPPKSLRDLIWAPVRVTFRHDGGGARTAFAPVRYPGVTEQSDPQLSLARETRWITTAAGAAIGQGQRLLFTEAESSPLLECRTVRFD